MDELLGKAADAKGKRRAKREARLEEETRLAGEIRARLGKSLSKSPVLYEVLCMANDLDVEDEVKNIASLAELANIYLFKGSVLIGLTKAKNRPDNFNPSHLMGDGNDFWVAELVLWDEVELYLMPYEDEKKGFACRVMEKDDLYAEPSSSGRFSRTIDVICDGDLNRNTALGLIEHYSGLFSEDQWRWHLLKGDFVTTQEYISAERKKRKKREGEYGSESLGSELREINECERRRLEEAMDDPDCGWVYEKEREDRKRGRGYWFVE